MSRPEIYMRLRATLGPVIGDNAKANKARLSLWKEAGREADFLAAVTAPVDPEPPDLSEYVTRMKGLVEAHANDWRVLARDYDDRARLAVEGLWMLAEAAERPDFAALAVELADTASRNRPGLDLTRDARMHAGFRDVVRVARLLEVPTLGLEGRLDALVSDLEGLRLCCVDGRSASLREWATKQHLEPLDMSVPTGAWQGQQSFLARLAPWGDEVRAAWQLDAADGIYGAGWVEGYPGARSVFKAGRDLAMARLAGDPIPASIWPRVYDGERFAEFIDGTSSPGFHGATSLEGWCLLPEARGVCRRVIAGGPELGTLYWLNHDDTFARDAYVVGATALGEVIE